MIAGPHSFSHRLRVGASSSTGQVLPVDSKRLSDDVVPVDVVSSAEPAEGFEHRVLRHSPSGGECVQAGVCFFGEPYAVESPPGPHAPEACLVGAWCAPTGCLLGASSSSDVPGYPRDTCTYRA
jgi:hypothetical protein